MLKTIVKQIRRNHAMEHATINVLSLRNPGTRAAGHSGPWGFILYTDLPVDDVVTAIESAQRGLLAGNADLAYHERCGTNIVVTATLTTLATLVGLGGHVDLKSGKFWLEKLPVAILLNAVLLIFSPKIAATFQRQVTTEADIGDLAVTSIVANPGHGIRRIQVRTE